MQNKNIYLRIDNTKSCYSIKEFDLEREKQLHLLKRIGKFPLKEIGKKNSINNDEVKKNSLIDIFSFILFMDFYFCFYFMFH